MDRSVEVIPDPAGESPAVAREGGLGRLIAMIATFVMAGFFATGARWFGIERNDLVIAIALIGAGVQSFLLVSFYLYKTRARAVKTPFGEPIRVHSSERPAGPAG